MTSTSAEADIRGINISKVAVQYLDEALIFRRYCNVTRTNAREIRWYRKTAGFLSETSPADTANTADGARPFVLEQSWERLTSYVRNYFVESPLISEEDVKDSDIDILLGNLRDLTMHIAYQVDSRIWNVITENQTAVNINSNASNASWDTADYTGVNIVDDLQKAKEDIRVNSGYDPDKYGGILFLSPKDERSLLNWLIDHKGSNIPSFSSARIGEGAVMEIMGLRVVVSNNVTADYAAVMIPNIACTWKTFTPLRATIMSEEQIGSKIRVKESGEAILERPKCVSLITNTQD